MNVKYDFSDLYDIQNIKKGFADLEKEATELAKNFDVIHKNIKNNGQGLAALEGHIAKINQLQQKGIELSMQEAKAKKHIFETGLNSLQINERLAKLDAQKAKSQKEELARNKKIASEKDKDESLLNKKLAQQQKQIDKEQEIIRLSKMEAKSIDDLTRKNAALVAMRKKLDLTTKEGRSEFNKLTTAIAKNEIQLKKYDAQIGRFQRNVGNYASAFKGLLGGLGIAGGAMMLMNGIKQAFGIMKTFEQTMKNLQAISGSTKKQIAPLQEKIQELGASTSFTATEVANASIELSKMGYSLPQIDASLKGVLDGAVALGVGIPEAAALAAKTINAFGLTAKDTERVMAGFSASANKTATSFQYFADSMPYAATSAKIAGYSFEQTAALLGILADNGIKAESAGVALRDIFSDLAKKGISMDDAMAKINSSTNKAKTAFNIFGKTSMNQAIILAQNYDKLAERTENVTDKQKELAKQVAMRLDTLQGDITIAQSAWEGFVLSVESGDGVISKSIRSIVQRFTEFATGLTDINNYGLSAVAAGIKPFIASEIEKVNSALERTPTLLKNAFLTDKVEYYKEAVTLLSDAITVLNDSEADSLDKALARDTLSSIGVKDASRVHAKHMMEGYEAVIKQLEAIKIENVALGTVMTDGAIILSKEEDAAANARKNKIKDYEDMLKLMREMYDENIAQTTEFINKEAELISAREAELFKVRAQFDEKGRATEDFKKLEASIYQKYDLKIEEANAQTAQEKKDAELEAFKDMQALAESQFEYEIILAETSGENIEDIEFRKLQFRKASINEYIAFLREKGFDISDIEAQQLQNDLLKIQDGILENRINRNIGGEGTAGAKPFSAKKLFQTSIGGDAELSDGDYDYGALLDEAGNAVSGWTDYYVEQSERRKQALEEEYEQIKAANEALYAEKEAQIEQNQRAIEVGAAYSTAEIDRINKEIVANEKKAREKQVLAEREARRQKAIALSTAFIETALLVIKALKAPPVQPNFIAAGLAGVAGAAQIASIVSRKFAKGTEKLVAKIPGTDTIPGIMPATGEIIALDGGERIVPKDLNSAMLSIPNEKLPEAVNYFLNSKKAERHLEGIEKNTAKENTPKTNTIVKFS